ncbi:MAG: T9SS type A sorting domain-containing protein [Candidatus Symbiothrix sp.]|nr:T9SS type A sorting domain-containing protein [Candidatus Symbiothrix sp.]
MKRLSAFFAGLLSFALTLSATTFYVTIDGSDEDGCGSPTQAFASIRAALTNTVSGDTIRVGEGTFLTQAKYEVIKDNAVTIIGSGNQNTILTAAADIRLFEINGGTLRLKNLCIKDISNNQEGGAIIAKSLSGKNAVLHCENVDFINNSAKGSPVARVEGGGARFVQCNFIENQSLTYGAIGLIASNYAFDEILISGCLFRENTANNNGSALRIYAQNNVEKCDIANNTFIGNHLTANSGTIAIEGGNASGNNRNIHILHNTIVNNTNVSDKTAGIFVNGTADNIVEIINNIIADNPSGDGKSYAIQLANVSLKASSNNLIDYTAAQIKLETLASNGGQTQSMALSAGSIAINCGKTDTGILIDQRGYLRDNQPDIGAYEYDAIPLNDRSDISGNNKLNVYPNPFSDVVSFSIPVRQIKIYAVDGKEVFSRSDRMFSSVNLNHLSTGNYVFYFTTYTGEKKSCSLIKE